MHVMSDAANEDDLAKGEALFVGTLICKASGRLGVTVRLVPSHSDLPASGLPGYSHWAS
jgi:hypothetical protein